jgi:phospholipase/carboxylesterase
MAASSGAASQTASRSGAVSAAPLTTLVRGSGGPPTLILLHGLGSSPSEWEPFVDTIGSGSPCRFVFPRGPAVTSGHDGVAPGRAWWALELQAHVPKGGVFPDLSRLHPRGLLAARDALRALLPNFANGQARPPVLGGFSQGAMVAGELAFTSDEPMAALVLLSVTPVDEAGWKRGFERRRGTPIFMAHGREDRSLSFEAADRLRRAMQAAGLSVTWLPFDGGHEMPEVVIGGLNDFLAARGLIQAVKPVQAPYQGQVH